MLGWMTVLAKGYKWCKSVLQAKKTKRMQQLRARVFTYLEPWRLLIYHFDIRLTLTAYDPLTLSTHQLSGSFFRTGNIHPRKGTLYLRHGNLRRTQPMQINGEAFHSGPSEGAMIPFFPAVELQADSVKQLRLPDGAFRWANRLLRSADLAPN